MNSSTRLFKKCPKFLLNQRQLPRYWSTTFFKCSNNDLTTEKKFEIELKWKDLINNIKYDEKSNKENYYVLSMFPYPSGNLHMGHVRVYTISDAAARYYRMRGKNVLHPFGFDSFGLPAENAARDRKIAPDIWTSQNIDTMRKQLKQLGCNFDWDREIITSDPTYYKWTQFLFLLLYEKGLVYKKKANVNWDPVDCTVLADEQVDHKGRSWRSGALVEKRLLEQWFIRTTHFAEDLWYGLNDLNSNDWKDIINLQKHWIGECTGANFRFSMVDENEEETHFTLWVEKPEHMDKGAFVAFSKHSVIGSEISNPSNSRIYYAKPPFSGKKLPIFVTDEIAFPEGCDAKLGMPSRSEEDKRFALDKNLDCHMEPVDDDFEERSRICQLAISSNLGGYPKSSKLQDWLISRQRKWGTPIPMVNCDQCGMVPVNLKNLPVLLSNDTETFVKTKCPKCGSSAKRETDTMDTFVDSSWYFLRFLDPKNPSNLFSSHLAKDLMPVNLYIGGKEHATLHLYYARFISYFLHSIGYLEEPEPFKRLLVQGMVMGKTYYVKNSQKCIRADQVEIKGRDFIEKETGLPVLEKWEKMSKSKFNGVEPSEILADYGVDTTRLLILSDVSPTSHRKWNKDSFGGILNWQNRIWVLMNDFLNARKTKPQLHDENVVKKTDKILYDIRNHSIRGITYNYSSSQQFSVAISRMQSLTNTLKKTHQHAMSNSAEFEKTLGSLIIMLCPMAPHFTSELWSKLIEAENRVDKIGEYFDWSKPVLGQIWPKLDDSYPMPLIFKVNNAVKSEINVLYKDFVNLSKDDAFNLAILQPKVQEFLSGCDIRGIDFRKVEDYEGTLNLLIDHRQRLSKLYG